MVLLRVVPYFTLPTMLGKNYAFRPLKLARTIDSPSSENTSLCLRGRPGMWRKHRGRVVSRVPQPNGIQPEVDLLMNGVRLAHLLNYGHDGH